MPITTKDILFLSLAISSAVLATLLSLLLYYAICSLRDVRLITKAVKERFEMFTKVVDRFKDKTSATATTATAISKAIIEVVEYARARKKKRKTKIKPS
ncbi:MAG: hypothetical protein A2249_01130 [Candidatus Jacksonbacteria bacterium RIFOXYA2_FULL_44_7]|uniref:Uncharacterized protein n=1 Tax=Candidatus Jacksonbacteria bacterium RIFCSPLOWO2_02_FULL_44_20 TaxID=1798460 RepID=A0A1G2A9U2_9BACT|nr:MAG: hypothetical protein UW39_C0010G0015 [Parcubacteria group bacterium GW2011_GWC2_44_17]KKT48389.1 MAG: hypothetical protein UW40_C0045G0008 [Parcubacteria group bacterium GW2011_GWF2_44_17]OGY69601.1 MAG: hypothetical protein A3C00_02230 [Candidatus Jacksonbacteria bacterium RIFCSPHIGHO2_02_FULL_44_25]OGY71982.1 MAG: hypothetical protein A3E05_02030 [Candidatus Jacksonbacteria bacterium RIFCSPHIGHO2_12_FULL_44_12]OGY73435.1 MAG: hypothetical protein A3H61_04770 [Candidatus Jacksonbacteri